jgi:hypothetical protein
MSATDCESTNLERVRYFQRQLMDAETMRAEQYYFLERMRRHNRLLHGWGIVCGLTVRAAATKEKPWRVQVCPGFALAPTGDEIYVPNPVLFDLERPDSVEESCTPCPCPPDESSSQQGHDGNKGTLYLAIRFVECNARPVRLGRADCGDSNTSCETTRIRDDFELALLGKVPVPYDEESRRNELVQLTQLIHSKPSALGVGFGRPIPPCCCERVDPWILLAAIRGPIEGTPNGGLATAIGGSEWRRLLPSVQDLLAVK